VTRRPVAGIPKNDPVFVPCSTKRTKTRSSVGLYRSLTRTLRAYNRLLLERLHARGFTDFAPSFPTLLSNLDTRGTRIGVLAMRGGVSRRAAGQLLRAIERCGYVELKAARDDARATAFHGARTPAPGDGVRARR